MPTRSQLLQRVYAMIKAGQRERARQILVAVLRAEPRDPVAWWLAANAAEDPIQVRAALERVLRLDPKHQGARRMLARLRGGQRTAPMPEPRKASPNVRATVPNPRVNPLSGRTPPAEGDDASAWVESTTLHDKPRPKPVEPDREIGYEDWLFRKK